MLSIFICEDITKHQLEIRKIIESYVTIENLDMQIAVSTDNPHSIIDYLQENQVSGLYFFDVDLKCDMNGIMLAEKVREYDPRGFIVFITAYPKVLPLTFKYKVEAMDFICKDDFFDIRSRIGECIASAHKRYTSTVSELQPSFTFKVYDQIITIEYRKIIYFETSTAPSHKITVHSKEGLYEFYGYFHEIEKSLSDKWFFRCHKSYIINLRQIETVEIKSKTVIFRNGETCPVSRKYFQQLTNLMYNQANEGVVI